MIIKIDNFKLKPNDQSVNNFDIIEVVTRTKKDKVKGEDNTYEAENTIAFAVSLEYALKTIVSIKLKNNEREVELKEFLMEYVKQKEELKNLINELLTIKN